MTVPIAVYVALAPLLWAMALLVHVALTIAVPSVSDWAASPGASYGGLFLKFWREWTWLLAGMFGFEDNGSFRLPPIFLIYAGGAIPAVFFGLLNHYVAGKVRRYLFVFIILIAAASIIIPVLFSIFLIASGLSFWDVRAPQYVRFVIGFGIPTAFTLFVCSSMSALIQRRRDRKQQGRLVKDVF